MMHKPYSFIATYDLINSNCSSVDARWQKFTVFWHDYLSPVDFTHSQPARNWWGKKRKSSKSKSMCATLSFATYALARPGSTTNLPHSLTVLVQIWRMKNGSMIARG